MKRTTAPVRKKHAPSKVTKRKGGTATTNKHRFQSFSHRISKLNIDSVRRNQARTTFAEDDDSHFLSGLESWKDRNLSESFTAFVQKVDPLCQNLLQIIHYEDDIASLLQEYIALGDNLSLEALLDLVARFAHDLGPRFEKHFGTLVQAVNTLAASHSDVAVIEWSFTCLAWLFKFLARLLVSDLRPLFDLMAPLLGREPQKDFITRFAADSMAFLVRKAAATQSNGKSSLELLVRHVYHDICAVPADQRELYQQGLSTLFADAIKGVQRGVSSGADSLYRGLLDGLDNLAAEGLDKSPARTIVEAVTIDVIHHTDPTGFASILETFMQWAAEHNQRQSDSRIPMQLLYIIVGTRKGSRISDWSPILSLISHRYNVVQPYAERPAALSLLTTSVVALQYGPFEQVVSFSQAVLRSFEDAQWQPYFLDFCNLFVDLQEDRERFDTLILPTVQKFVIANWQAYQERLCVTLPKAVGSPVESSRPLRLPQDWANAVATSLAALVADLENASHKTQDIDRLSSLNGHLGALLCMKSGADTLQPLAPPLRTALDLVTETDTVNPSLAGSFLMGSALPVLIDTLDEDSMSPSDCFSVLKQIHPYARHPAVLSAVLRMMKKFGSKLPFEEVWGHEHLTSSLLNDLAAPSQELRRLSLEIVIALFDGARKPIPEVMRTAQELQDYEPTVANLRTMSLLIRRIGTAYEHDDASPFILRFVVAYCFGLLNVRLTPLWSDACGALKVIRSAPGADALIVDRAIDWLSPEAQEVLDDHHTVSTNLDETNQEGLVHELPGFQCTNLSRLDGVARKSYSDGLDPHQSLIENLLHDTRQVPAVSRSNRMQALLVFREMPDLAEKKSRQLVPILLDWASNEDNMLVDVSIGNMQDEPKSKVSTWSRLEQKTLLELFTGFVNPGVLYRADEVYRAMLNLLCNGDLEIQRAALKTVFTWKSPSVRPYQINLLNLLDEARFREELTTFVNKDESDGIRGEHRQGLLPVLVRLLYGRIVTRSGIGGSRGSQEARRKAVFTALSKLGDDAVHEFVDISIVPVMATQQPQSSEGPMPMITSLHKGVTPRKLLGMFNMLRDLLQTLPNFFSKLGARITQSIMNGLTEAAHQATRITENNDQASLLKDVRQEGLACLNLTFATSTDFRWVDGIRAPLFEHFISPRLANLPIETAQAPSIVLKLFSTWSLSPETVGLLWQVEPGLLQTAADCLSVPSAKDDVRMFVLDQIIGNVISRASMDQNHAAKEHLEQGLAAHICQRIAHMLKLEMSNDCLVHGVQTVIKLQQYVLTAEAALELFEISLALLTQSARKLSPKVKGEVLVMIQAVLPRLHLQSSPATLDKALSTLSSLFNYFLDGKNREALVQIFNYLGQADEGVDHAAKLCSLLNASSTTRLDEPDFEARGQAFAQLQEMDSSSSGPRFWKPVLHNLLFFVRDENELATRSGASLALRRYIHLVLSNTGDITSAEQLIEAIIIPALQKGMKEHSELVRAEVVSVLAVAVKDGYRGVEDMRCLLGTDEESSFFNNILHIQPHRRIRALQKLVVEAANISAINLNRFCLPLIQHFWAEVDEASHNLAHEAIKALESLAGNLEWHHYRALLQRIVQDKSTFTTKVKIRTLAAVVNGLLHASKPEAMGQKGSGDAQTSNAEATKALAKSLPQPAVVSKTLTDQVLSKLFEQIHYQDEASMDMRILLALVAVRLILILPAEEVDTQLPAVLMDVCNILKSRAQEARDAARKTLADIAVLIGPKYFGFILKQLRTALKRGGQLHVLAYTVHSLVVAVTPSFGPGSLDYCVSDIVSVAMDATFGSVGQDKEAQGYLNSMKEFKKKNIGYDTMELLATITTMVHVSKLIMPVQAQLEHYRPKTEKVDEMLRRLREGLRRNELMSDRTFLTLCYEILVEAKLHLEQNGSSLRSIKMSAFAFELLRRLLDKHEVLKTPQNLEGFMPFLSVSLKSDDEEVQMSSMRFLSSIIKVPLKDLDEQSGTYIRMAKRIIEGSSSVHTPNAQAALRLVAAVLRERPAAVIKKSHFEQDIAYLLIKIKPDLEEPGFSGERERQVAAFNLLKAVLARGVLIKEIYEVMDTVREVMITSSAPPIPDLARGVYAKFVLDCFPEEGKGLARQLEFLTSNLQYEHERGRRSIMEVMMFLLNKRTGEAVQHLLTTFFLPLMLVLIADENPQCRENALVLVEKIFEKSDKERTKTFKAQLTTWIEQDADPLWTDVALKVWATFLEVHPDATADAETVAPAATAVILEASDTTESTPLPLRSALRAFHRLVVDFPAIALGEATASTWEAVAWQSEREETSIQTAAAELVGLLLADFSAASIDSELPIHGSHGLQLTAATVQPLIAGNMALLQSTRSLDEGLSGSLMKNITFLARLCASSSEVLLDSILQPTSAGLRRELPSSQPPYAKFALARLLESLLRELPVTALDRYVFDLLLPLNHLSSVAIPVSTHPDFEPISTSLKTLTAELMQSFQEKLGPERYIKEMGEVQKIVRERREERGKKRVMDRVTAPERAERDRKRKRMGDKDRRSRKSNVREGMRRGW